MNNYSIGSKILPYLREVDNLVNDRYQPFVSCEIDPSNHCQLDCSWCFFKKMRKSNLVDLDIQVYRKSVLSLYGMGCKSITFTGGGEPLMHPQINEMIEFAYIHHMKVGIITNGIDLHKIERNLNKLTFIRVSLDCATSESYERLKGADKFNQICDNIRMVTDTSKCDVGLSMVHVPSNSNEIEKFIELSKDLGVDYVQVKASWRSKNIEKQTGEMQHPSAFVTERYTVLPKGQTSYHHLPCMIAGLCGSIAADGKLYYCCVHRGDPAFEVWDLNSFHSFKPIIKYRANMRCDITKCGSCRYMNFAKVYEQVMDKKYTMLRHREFI